VKVAKEDHDACDKCGNPQAPPPHSDHRELIDSQVPLLLSEDNGAVSKDSHFSFIGIIVSSLLKSASRLFSWGKEREQSVVDSNDKLSADQAKHNKLSMGETTGVNSTTAEASSQDANTNYTSAAVISESTTILTVAAAAPSDMLKSGKEVLPIAPKIAVSALLVENDSSSAAARATTRTIAAIGPSETRNIVSGGLVPSSPSTGTDGFAATARAKTNSKEGFLLAPSKTHNIISGGLFPYTANKFMISTVASSPSTATDGFAAAARTKTNAHHHGVASYSSNKCCDDIPSTRSARTIDVKDETLATNTTITIAPSSKSSLPRNVPSYRDALLSKPNFTVGDCNNRWCSEQELIPSEHHHPHHHRHHHHHHHHHLCPTSLCEDQGTATTVNVNRNSQSVAAEMKKNNAGSHSNDDAGNQQNKNQFYGNYGVKNGGSSGRSNHMVSDEAFHQRTIGNQKALRRRYELLSRKKSKLLDSCQKREISFGKYLDLIEPIEGELLQLLYARYNATGEDTRDCRPPLNTRNCISLCSPVDRKRCLTEIGPPHYSQSTVSSVAKRRAKYQL